MPRTLKRRAEAISRDESEADSDDQPSRPTQRQTQQRQRRRSTPASDVSHSDLPQNDSDNDGQDSQTQLKTMVKKLVRLALSTEYARQPLRRTDVQTKVLKGDTTTSHVRVNFRAVFLGAQKVLREVFGMELVDLPTRERTGLNERRKAASQKATQKEQATQRARQAEGNGDLEDAETQRGRAKDPVVSAQNWILVSILPAEYRSRMEILVPQKSPDVESEGAYVALYTVVVSIIYLHTPSGVNGGPRKDGQNADGGQEDTTEPISDAKLMRFLGRLGLNDWTPMNGGANVDKFLARMIKEGYVEKRRDTSGGEEVVEWVVGPRGKREVGRQGVAGLVRGVYGFGIDGKGAGLELPLPVEDDDEDEQEEHADGDQPQRRKPVKIEKDELERRLRRTLGDVVALKIDNTEREQLRNALDQDMDEEQPDASRRRDKEADHRTAPRRSGRRRNQGDEEDE